jgi:hypothetical protein
MEYMPPMAYEYRLPQEESEVGYIKSGRRTIYCPLEFCIRVDVISNHLYEYLNAVVNNNKPGVTFELVEFIVQIRFRDGGKPMADEFQIRAQGKDLETMKFYIYDQYHSGEFKSKVREIFYGAEFLIKPDPVPAYYEVCLRFKLLQQQAQAV